MSFLTSLGDAIKEQVMCPLLQSNTALNSSLRDLIELATGFRPPSLEPLGVYQMGICPLPLPPPQLPVPFEGGQCPVMYRVFATSTYENLLLDGTWETVTVDSSDLLGMGAISAIEIVEDFSVDGSPCDNNVLTRTLRVMFADGEATTPLPSEYNCGSFLGGIRNVIVDGFTVTREDGLPDVCGDPEPIEPVPPVPPEGTEPFPFSFPITINEGGTPITIDVGGLAIILPPRIGINADITVPVSVNFDVGGINFSPTVNLNFNLGDGSVSTAPSPFPISFGGITINNAPPPWNSPPGGLPPGGGAPRPLPDAPVPPSPPGADPPPTERPPQGERVIVGVLVTVTSVGIFNRSTVIYQDDNPDIYAPDLGHVNFLCRIGTSATGGWTPDQKVKNRRCLIPCPWEYGAIEVRGTPQAGVTWVLTPVYDVVRSPVKQ